ncbi:cytochrome P450 [Tanacetum coccineum]
MNIASLNINGVGSAPKKKWARRISHENNVSFFGIQETKTSKVDVSLIHSLWGNHSYDFAFKNSDGNSGRIIAIWDSTMFTKNVVVGDGFLTIFGDWAKIKTSCLMITVYGPQDSIKKCNLWVRLTKLILDSQVMSIVLGDFNKIRSENERLGSLFCKSGAKHFNEFISNSELVDLPIGGKRFTIMNKYDTKPSKIDRTFVSQHFISKWPNAKLNALSRDLLDHCPLLLKTHFDDYGPIAFKFFNLWLLTKNHHRNLVES